MEDLLTKIEREMPEILVRFEENYEEPTFKDLRFKGLKECEKCGALTAGVTIHRRWHKNLSIGIWLGVDFIVKMILESKKDADDA